MPFSLVYGTKNVFLIEPKVKSLRVFLEAKILENEWVRKRYKGLSLLDEKRLRALHHMQAYQKKIAQAFNRKVKQKSIKVGDLMLKKARSVQLNPYGKFNSNWDGPYLVKQILLDDVVRLSDLDDGEFQEPINLVKLKMFFV